MTPARTRRPAPGGTTTLVYDTKRQQVEREFLSLGGRIRNCAGGPTPRNSWITCEEAQDVAAFKVLIEQSHGYNFEILVNTTMALADPARLKDMGRFRHEAVAVDEKGIVYQTEDQGRGLTHRFLPHNPRKLQ